MKVSTFKIYFRNESSEQYL